MSSASDEEHERLGPVGPRRGPRGELDRQHPPALDVARSEVRARRRSRAAIEVGAALRRRQPHRVLAELRGDHRCALRGRRPGRGFEQRSEIGVWAVGRERKVTRAGERILDDLCETTVDALPLAGRQPLVEDRGQKRVREPDRAAGELDHVRSERRLECAGLDPGAGKLCRSQARIRGREHEHLARRCVEAVEAGGDELLQPFGDGERLRRIRHRAVGAERPRKLERVERIPARHRVQPEQRRPGQAVGEQAVQDLMRRADAERPDPDPLDPVAVERVLDRGRLLRLAEPPRPQQRDVGLRQPAQRKPERACRRDVEPLQVVDRDHQPILGEQLESAPNRNSERPLVDTALRGILDQQGDLERPAPRRGQGRQHLLERVVEQVAEAGVGERALRLGGARREHAPPAAARLLDGGAPERRLPDPGIAFQGDRDRASHCATPVEKRRQRADLHVSAHDLDCHVRAAIVTGGIAKVSRIAAARRDELLTAWRRESRSRSSALDPQPVVRVYTSSGGAAGLAAHSAVATPSSFVMFWRSLHERHARTLRFRRRRPRSAASEIRRRCAGPPAAPHRQPGWSRRLAAARRTLWRPRR